MARRTDQEYHALYTDDVCLLVGHRVLFTGKYSIALRVWSPTTVGANLRSGTAATPVCFSVLGAVRVLRARN